MTQTLNPAEEAPMTLIRQTIEFNTATAGGSYDEYWTPEIEAKITEGPCVPTLYVTSRAPGLGKTVIYTAYLGLKLSDGTHVSCTPVHVERINSNLCRPSVRQYGEKLARKEFRTDYPMQYSHSV
jgi:hypothetical protein